MSNPLRWSECLIAIRCPVPSYTLLLDSGACAFAAFRVCTRHCSGWDSNSWPPDHESDPQTSRKTYQMRPTSLRNFVTTVHCRFFITPPPTKTFPLRCSGRPKQGWGSAVPLKFWAEVRNCIWRLCRTGVKVMTTNDNKKVSFIGLH